MVQASSALSSLPSAGYLALFLVIFSLVSYDVSSPLSSHILRPVDEAVHNNVVGAVPLEFRAFTADKVISNVPIGFAFLCSLVGLQLLVSKHWQKGFFLGGLLGVFNFLCALHLHAVLPLPFLVVFQAWQSSVIAGNLPQYASCQLLHGKTITSCF